MMTLRTSDWRGTRSRGWSRVPTSIGLLGEPGADRPAGGDEREAAERTLFTLLMGLREPAIAEVFVQGRRVQLPR